MVISPDANGLNRAIYFANVLGVNTGMFYKRRNYSQHPEADTPSGVKEFLGDGVDGKDVILIDDIIDTGSCVLETARLL